MASQIGISLPCSFTTGQMCAGGETPPPGDRQALRGGGRICRRLERSCGQGGRAVLQAPSPPPPASPATSPFSLHRSHWVCHCAHVAAFILQVRLPAHPLGQASPSALLTCCSTCNATRRMDHHQTASVLQLRSARIVFSCLLRDSLPFGWRLWTAVSPSTRPTGGSVRGTSEALQCRSQVDVLCGEPDVEYPRQAHGTRFVR